jgi:predicted regulator of Ras-like GTPase activity (Roadblock/LC7/MglB family)
MDSMAMGKRAVPTMELLAARLPQLRSAVLCTGDGFNVCSIGVTESQLGKLAALASSLFTMGEATLSSLSDDTDGGPSGLDVLTLEAGGSILVAVQVPHPTQPLVLMIGARSTPLGVLHLRARQSADELGRLFGAGPRAPASRPIQPSQPMAPTAASPHPIPIPIQQPTRGDNAP